MMPRKPNRARRKTAARQTAGGGVRSALLKDRRRAALAALAAESDRHLEDLIARRLALPVEKRMNFLRRRLPGGGSCL